MPGAFITQEKPVLGYKDIVHIRMHVPGVIRKKSVTSVLGSEHLTLLPSATDEEWNSPKRP